ncbi:MAG: O-antigen ligase family protein [Alphaproteobacteria bacterium]|nr:O-antigen ligase family protein [Alphaproteobacteria bacterium]
MTALFFTGYANLFYAPALLCLVAGGIMGTISALRRPDTRIPTGMAVILLFVFWFYMTVSLTWTSIPFTSLVTWLVITSFPLTILVLLTGGEPERRIRLAGAGLLFFLAALGGWAVFDYLTTGARASGPLPNPNTLAGLINLGLIPALAVSMDKNSPKRDAFYTAFGAFLCFAGLLATESRGGLIAALIAVLVLLFVLRHALDRKRTAILLVCGIFLLTFFSWTAHRDESFADFFAPQTEANVAARLSLWHAAGEMIADHPLIGTGLGTFFRYYPAYRAPDRDNSAGYWVHNDPLQFAAEAGLAAPFLFYTFLVAVLWRTIRALRALPPDSPLRGEIIAPFCALLAIAIHTHATFHLYILSILIACAVWFAVWYRATARALPEGVSFKELPARRVTPILFAGFLCLFAVMTITSAAGTYFTLQAKQAIQSGRTADFLAALAHARRYGPATLPDPEVMEAGFYIDLLQNPDFFTSEERQAMTDRAGLLLADAETHNPAWAEIDHKQARLALILGRPDDALSAWETALGKDPLHAKSRLGLAALLMRQGAPAKAYDLLEQGLHYPRSQALDKEIRTLMTQIEPLARLQKIHQP